VLVEGGGTIDMKRETTNLRVQGKPKHFRLLRVRAPVTVSGRWDAPVVGVEAGPTAPGARGRCACFQIG
jgi:hypothetical protein